MILEPARKPLGQERRVSGHSHKEPKRHRLCNRLRMLARQMITIQLIII